MSVLPLKKTQREAAAQRRPARPYPFKSCKSICGKAFACASMEVADWVSTWLRTNVVISVATSTSEIRDSAACRLSACTLRLVTVFSSRFYVAPKWARI